MTKVRRGGEQVKLDPTSEPKSVLVETPGNLGRGNCYDIHTHISYICNIKVPAYLSMSAVRIYVNLYTT